jgi:general secretion pathway protein G
VPSERKDIVNQHPIAQRNDRVERGFTLIELLVVIVILGILAAVVVFAVGGVGDKGQESACRIDDRTLRTSEEAYAAQSVADGGGGGNYGTETQLVGGGFLSEESEYHEVTNIVDRAPGADTKFGTADDVPASFDIAVVPGEGCVG